MEIFEEKTANCLILELKGRLDATNSNSLEEKLEQYIAQKQNNMILNCSGLEYISSSGLRVLLSHLKKIRFQNGKLVLCNLNQNLMEIFTISGFSHLFEIVATLEDAKQKFV